MIFVTKGDAPLTEAQIHRTTQAYIERDWPAWKRERAMRTNDEALNTYMDGVSADTDVNRELNTFNQQIVDFKAAEARLEQYQVELGREEVRAQVPTGEITIDEETGEEVEVTEERVIVEAIDPLPAEVEVTTINENGEEVTETIPNPEIAKDREERAAAQAVVDGTPLAVKEFVASQS